MRGESHQISSFYITQKHLTLKDVNEMKSKSSSQCENEL